jgi:hypothetical protein
VGVGVAGLGADDLGIQYWCHPHRRWSLLTRRDEKRKPPVISQDARQRQQDSCIPLIQTSERSMLVQYIGGVEVKS